LSGSTNTKSRKTAAWNRKCALYCRQYRSLSFTGQPLGFAQDRADAPEPYQNAAAKKLWPQARRKHRSGHTSDGFAVRTAGSGTR
jgi:hypothetical protein